MSFCAVIIISQYFFLAEATEISEPTANPLSEIQKLADIFRQEVSTFQPEEDYVAAVKKDIAQKINAAVDLCFVSQYFVYADRNEKRQNVLVGFWDEKKEAVEIIGWSKCSTGNPKHGKDYHFTPIGIFANTTENVGYRAQGTKNSLGWRGFGAKGSRVWDFGWQKTHKPIKGKLQERTIRLLMHATDPDGGEKRLGGVDSKGCVRISAKLNKFLDVYGIIDANYEAAEKDSH